MKLPECGWQRVGQMLLRWEGNESPEAEESLLDLAPARQRLDDWWESGGFSGLRSVAQLAEPDAGHHPDYSLLACGPGAALPGLAALAFGLKNVHMVLPAEDQQAFDDAARLMIPDPNSLHLDSAAAAPEQSHHFCLFGCGRSRPEIAAAAPLARALRREGRLIFFGLPFGEVQGFFEELAGHGFSLHGSGTAEGLAYLSGSLLNSRRFQS